MPSYICEKCDQEFKQKSDYTRHVNKKYPCITQKELSDKIDKVTESIKQKVASKTEDIDDLENDLEKELAELTKTEKKRNKNIKIIDEDDKNVKEINNSDNISNSSNKKPRAKPKKIQVDTDYSYLRLPENKIIYDLKETDLNNAKIKQILKLIDKAHNILFQAESIVGQKALQIIMSLLFIKLIQPFLSDEQEPGKIDLLNKEYYLEKFDDEEELDKILGYFKNLKTLTKLKAKDIRSDKQTDAIKQMGEILKRHPITKMVYTEANFIKVKEASTIQTLINDVIDDINFKDFENNEDVIGEIYEYMLSKYVKSDSKELGQFFTPRKLMKLILSYKKDIINNILSKVNKGEKASIYDSCMGTGGWLVTTFNMFSKSCKNLNVAGGEVEPETFQYGLMNICMTLKNFPEDINCNSSLTHINKNKHDIITTNPPFNSKKQIKFTQIKTNLNNDKYTTDENKIKIDDVYILKKDDPPIQFLELDIYKLKENGLCIIVLPYGEFFSGKSYAETRKHFMSIVNITDIILVPSGIFTHTNIRTCVIIFEKNKKGTLNITFSRINDECNQITKISTVSINDIKKEPNLSWYHGDYLNDKLVDNFENKINNFKWVEFGKIFTLEKGKIQSSKVEESEDGEGILISKDNQNRYKKINKNICTNDGENIFITHMIDKSCAAYIRIKYYDGLNTHTDLMSILKINSDYRTDINIKYIYFYLKSIEKHIENVYYKGTLQESIDIKNFNRMKIPIPPIEIQDRLVKKMDSSNDKVTYMRKIVEIMKEDINTFFEWTLEIENKHKDTEWAEFGKVFTLEKGKIQSSKVEEVEENEEGVVFMTGAKDENLKKIKKQNVSYLKGENIFISPNGNGNKRPVKYFNGECNYSDLLSVMIMNNNYKGKINKKYVYYYLKMLQEHIEENYQKGSCNQSLDEKNFNRMKIQIPPIEHQNECVEKLTNIENTIKRWEKDIEEILNDGTGKFIQYLEMESIKLDK